MTTDKTVPMAITMGDASGVGPEIVLRRAADGAFVDDEVVIYGDAAILRHGAELLGVDVEIEALADPGQWRPGRPLQVVDLALLRAADHRPGEIDAASGAAARQYVVAATNDALAGRVAGIDGTFTVSSPTDGGTLVRAELPVSTWDPAASGPVTYWR